MHDISYLIITALSVSDRRMHERALISHYLDWPVFHGVATTLGAEGYEYRLAANWRLYIGWLTTPKTPYGGEITVCNVIGLLPRLPGLSLWPANSPAALPIM